MAFLGVVWTGGAVHIPAGGYLYAEHHNDLMMPADGITVEGWFYLDEYPAEGAFLAPLITKPGSYSIVLVDRPKFGLARVVDPGPYVQLNFWDHDSHAIDGRLFCGGFRGRSAWSIPDANPVPAGEWMHVAFEMRDRQGDALTSYYLNGGRLVGRGQWSHVGEWDAPLYVGGMPEPNPCFPWTQHVSWPGSVDAIRVSRGARYDQDLFVPERDLHVDEDTIALWRLDGLADAHADLSGNGHALVSGGSLPVSPRPKLATTWGMLRTP